MRVQRHLTPEQLAAAQLAELRRALDRLDWKLPAATTLLGLERRLLRYAGPHSAGYARRLRAHRYDPRAPAAPGPRDRRALRRELSARGGLERGCAAWSPSRQAARARLKVRAHRPSRVLRPSSPARLCRSKVGALQQRL